MDRDVLRFFEENINRYLLLFKLEYIKFIHSLIYTDKKAALQPERNLTLLQDAANKSPVKTAPPKSPVKTASSKSPVKEEEKSPNKDENSRDNIRGSEVDPRASTKSTVSTKSELPQRPNESIDYIPVSNIWKLDLTVDRWWIKSQGESSSMLGDPS